MAVKQVIFRMEPEEYVEVEALWKQAGFKRLQEAGLHAFRTAFQAGPDATVPVKYRPYLKMLAELLASGDEDLIGLVVKPLEFASRQLRAGGGGKAVK